MMPVLTKPSFFVSYREEQTFYILTHTLYSPDSAVCDIEHISILMKRPAGQKFSWLQYLSKAVISEFRTLSPHGYQKAPLKVVGLTETVRSKRRRMHLEQVKVSGGYDHSFLFYSPSVIRNGKALEMCSLY